jgi:hypothetical protein
MCDAPAKAMMLAIKVRSVVAKLSQCQVKR